MDAPGWMAAINGHPTPRTWAVKEQRKAVRVGDRRCIADLVNLAFASWNQIVLWLRTLDTFRPDA
jgi:hypothetical protein